MSYSYDYPLAAEAPASTRATFIRRTYAHLAGAILAFAALEAFLLNAVPMVEVLGLLAATRYSWLIVLAVFMAVSWIAERWAQSDCSPGLQYLGLGLYVVAEAVIFLPLLYLADSLFPDQNLIATAGIMTLTVFGGLTLGVFVTRQDFSGLRMILAIGSWILLGVIVAGILFGFSLGIFFCLAVIALACGYILFHTSNVLHHYRTDQHVAASLALFACVALLFWYILRFLMLVNRR
jgi:FtsH-binding integral membrane protein